MNKLLLILCIQFLFTGITYSQVFVSQTLKGYILLGPDNVNHHQETNAKHHFNLVLAFQTELEKNKLDFENSIADLEATGKQRKKSNKRKMSMFQSQLTMVEDETVLVHSLVEMWTKIMENHKALSALSNSINNDECFEANTEQGIFTTDQLEIETIQIPSPENDAFIKVANKMGTGGRWVKKKKSPNCVSENPEDCYVACYEKDASSYSIEDMTGNLVSLRNNPMKMVYDESNKTYYLKTPNATNLDKLSILKSKESGEALDLISYNKIDCVSK